MRKIFIIFSFLIILTACGNKQTDNEVINEDALELETSDEITDETIQEPSEEKSEEINQVSSLKDFTPDQLEEIKITEKDGDRILIDDYLSSAKIISDTEAIFLDNNYQTVRNSSQALYSEGFDDGQIKVKDIIYRYSADDITLNGFVRKNSNYIFDVIVDPAYMYGLPVYVSTDGLKEVGIKEIRSYLSSITVLARNNNAYHTFYQYD